MPVPVIRKLALSEIETLISWAALEGWNPGINDAAAFQVADPEGFLGGFIDGKMVAGISAIAYGSDFGFIGLYICRSDLRGKGYGKAVWDAGMARLEGRTIGLDGVPEQQANYRSMGFAPAYRTFRFSGSQAVATDDHKSMLPLRPDLLPLLTSYDRKFFPGPRPNFLGRWLHEPHRALAFMDGQAIRGYGVARQCREGFKIGPLFADDRAIAKSLLGALAAKGDGDMHVDAPETNAAFTDVLLEAGMTKGFETMRMYRGPAPQVQDAGIFGVTTLELG